MDYSDSTGTRDSMAMKDYWETKDSTVMKANLGMMDC